jgi:hypothetical protein
LHIKYVTFFKFFLKHKFWVLNVTNCSTFEQKCNKSFWTTFFVLLWVVVCALQECLHNPS